MLPMVLLNFTAFEIELVQRMKNLNGPILYSEQLSAGNLEKYKRKGENHLETMVIYIDNGTIINSVWHGSVWRAPGQLH